MIPGSNFAVSGESQTTQNETQAYESVGAVGNGRFNASSESVPSIHSVRGRIPPANDKSLQYASEALLNDREVILAAIRSTGE